MRAQFAFNAVIFTVLVIFISIIGFGGVSTQVDVRYGACESHYRQYELKPFLPPLLCLTGRFKPCGDFVGHQNRLIHIQMLECLCRDPNSNAGNLREYVATYFTESGLGNDHNAICQARPRTDTL